MVRDFSAVYDHVLVNLLSGNERVAAQELGTVPSWQAPSDAGYVPRSVSASAQLKVFRRDSFTCRYSDRRTIFPPVLRLLSIAFNGVFPYHPHGKMNQCHLAFWRDLASCDHLVPVARFGKSDEQNLVTACYMCNSAKQNWTRGGTSMGPSSLERLLSRALALELSVGFVDPFYDIDVADDLTRLAAELGLAPERATRRAVWLKERERVAAQLRTGTGEL